MKVMVKVNQHRPYVWRKARKGSGEGRLYRLNICPVPLSPALDVPIIALNSCNSFTYSVHNIEDGGGGALRPYQGSVAPESIRVCAGERGQSEEGSAAQRRNAGQAASPAFGS